MIPTIPAKINCAIGTVTLKIVTEELGSTAGLLSGVVPKAKQNGRLYQEENTKRGDQLCQGRGRTQSSEYNQLDDTTRLQP